ncbi:(3R)-3-hydroxyacyl-CoA dehydrogenase-like isoform X3 [Macrobrachium rosenbergii]
MMSQLFAGKVALVTGGGSGIGRAVCRILARDGARVVAADMNLNGAQETVTMLINPSNHLAVNMNVSDKASVSSCFQRAMEELKAPPSLLVNAAGITKDNFLLNLEEQAFMDVLDVNVKGPFLLTQAMASTLLEKEINGGAIVNVSSIVAKSGNMGQASYSASKAALHALTKTSAKELARQGIRVNCVLPGFINTPMIATVPDKVKNMVLQFTTLRRLGEPEEIAEVVAFLLSDKSSYITGSCIEVTGGFNM